MADPVPVVGASSHGYRPIILSDWVHADMARQGLRLILPGEVVWPAWDGFYCVGSGCLEDRTDSHMQCINCGEPLLYVTDAIPTDGEEPHG